MVLIKNTWQVFLFISLTSLFSCKSQGFKTILEHENIMIELNIDIPDNIETPINEVPIFIELINSSNQDLKISSLKYWSNITFELKRGTELVYGIKVKPDLSKKNEYVVLKKDGRIKEKFDFQLNQIYRDLSSGSYEIEAKFIGNILNVEEAFIKPMQPIRSQKKFTIQ